jgi:2'-5' RNA ligase
MLKTFDQFVAENLNHAIENSQSLDEGANTVHNYGCAMVYFDFPQIAEVHSQIDPSHVYTEEGDNSYGLENEPHTTLLFGLHSNEIDDAHVIEACKSQPIGELVLHNASLFEGEQYDVLKFDVENGPVYEINKRLSQFPHTTKFPDYHPHATVGYLKKGMGKQYADRFNSHRHKVKAKEIVYSKPDGTKIHESWN